ncbi:MAG: prepilin-type N-terminal cleavage/methylation domain-containing protein [bacterium]
MRKAAAFTLIELLIVVAIIGILAAIAVPNFLNAQIRAKIARSYADMKTTMTGIEQFRLDRGILLVDFWDDDTAIGKDRMTKDFGGVGLLDESRRRQLHVLAPLTSPIAYLSSIPTDPFTPSITTNTLGGNSERFGLVGNEAYLYMDEDPQIPELDHGGTSFDPDLKPGDYVLFGFGPAAKEMYGAENGVRYGVPYDPTNGSVSIGDIMMRSGGGPVTVNRAGGR